MPTVMQGQVQVLLSKGVLTYKKVSKIVDAGQPVIVTWCHALRQIVSD